MDKFESKSCGCASTPSNTTRLVPSGPANRVTYRIDNMDCLTEEALIRNKFGSLAGITGQNFNLMHRTSAVILDLPSLERAEDAIAGIAAMQFNLVPRKLILQHVPQAQPAALAALKFLGLEAELEGKETAESDEAAPPGIRASLIAKKVSGVRFSIE